MVESQVLACREVVSRLGGRFDPLFDVFVGACGHTARHGPTSVLEDAVGFGMYDGVVVPNLRVLPVGDYQVFLFRAALMLGSCELYVADRPASTLWGPFGGGLESSVAAAGDRCGPGGRPVGVVHPEVWWCDLWRFEPERLLRVPVWSPPGSAGDWRARTWTAALSAVTAVDVAEAALAGVEAALFAEAGRGVSPSFDRLGPVSASYRVARMRQLVSARLAAVCGGG